MILTQENANEYVGKTLDAKHGLFHYYPLKVVKMRDGYNFIDRHDTMMRVPEEKYGGIYFDEVIPTTMEAEAEE